MRGARKPPPTPAGNSCAMFSRRSPTAAAKLCAARLLSSPNSTLPRRLVLGQILAHIGDLLDWALSQVSGKERWSDSKPVAWDDGVKRFFAGLKALDDYIASDAALSCTPEKLFQGGLADMLTHIGQISMLRRLGGSHVRAENYSRAEIVAGRVGSEQTPPEREFN